MRKRIACLCAALSVLVAPVAASAETPADQLVIGMSMNNILTLDPAAITGRETTFIATNIYDTLVENHPIEGTRTDPGLAESWAIDKDGTITFKLRKGATFASGNPVTIDDVEWSIKRTISLGLVGSGFWKMSGYNVENMDTFIRVVNGDLVVSMAQPDDPKLVLALFGRPDAAAIIDKKEALAHEKDGDKAVAWLTTEAAGSGPFVIKRWTANNLMMLDRNTKYWREAPAMKRVIFRHMPESQTKRLMLQKGDIDVGLGLSVPDIKALSENPDVTVQAVPSAGFYYLAVNMKDERFAKKEVREALRYLIDYEGINKTVMPNYGVFHQWPVTKNVLGSLADPGWHLDVPKAKALLAKAGYPDGFEVELRALNEPPFLDAATAIQATLAEAGIKAKIVSGTGNQVYGPMRARTFEMIVGRGGGGKQLHPDSNLRALVVNPDNSDDAGLSGIIIWRTAFQSEELNRMAQEALVEKDIDKQRKMYEDLQRRWADIVSSLQPFSAVVDTTVFRSDVQGYINHYAFTTRLREVTKAR